MDHRDVMRVIEDVIDGWGVEDIALRRRVTVEFARKVVANLRASGTLCAVLGRE